MIRFFLFVLLVASAFPARSAIYIDDIVLSPSTATPGQSVNVSVSVYGASRGSKKWQSTGYLLNGSFHCVNTPNHNGNGLNTESFNITAPNGNGSYPLRVRAFGDDNCSWNNYSGPYTVNLDVDNSTTVISNVALDPTTVAPGGTVRASVSVYGSGNGVARRWRSTSYVLDGVTQCVNTANHDTTSVRTESFDITAPTNKGTHSLRFYSHPDNNCNDSGSSPFYINLEVDDIAGSCPAVNTDRTFVNPLGDVQINQGIIINEVSQQNDWVEFYVPPNTYIDFTNAQLEMVSNANGNGTGTYTICTNSCQYYTTNTGAYIIFGKTNGLSADLVFQNNSLTIHPTWQEMLLKEGDGDLLHYLRYGNESGTPNGFPRYDNCDSSASTIVLKNGNDKHICAVTDGAIPNSQWSINCSATPGATNARALSCPNTSGYTEIFTDDFSSNKGVYVTNDFTRSVSVWPGESIVNDNDEDQSVDYTISGNRMNIEGSIGANSEGNNEYGAVLHDLTTERYEPQNINDYSIEVDMYAPTASSGYLNNDVGVVFGYQNDNNYYVIKWTKYGDRFSNEQEYPGAHKNLDLIKVSNGVATSLDSVANYDAAYPSRIKITVNANGIVICFDGTAVLAAESERPPIHKYGFFTYENEEGVSFDNLSIKCNGCQQTLQCPNTSAYSLIFEDKFNTSPNNNWQAHTLDRNTVNVWPNDTIYSNNEERSIMFAVRNGLMDIAGSVSSRSDNEYGVVVHDVVAEGFDDSQINTYSINTKFRSHSSQTNNNDAGVVFGYQNERNLYVLKWTKYAQNYASDTVFPGRHRDLEVIKVVNGQPTQLGVEANFYAADDMDLKITVNADGITICVNGDNLIQIAGERPTLGEIGFFSYDNDYGVSFDDFQVWCQGCSVNNNVDHYRIVHPTAGLTCSNYNVTVAACQNASCSSYSTETVTTQLMKTVGTSTSLVQALNTTTGTQVVNFAHPSAQTVTFSVANLSPAADNALRCVTGSINGASTNCQLVMADSGYVVTVGDFESASGWQTVNVKAMKRDSTSPGSCAPAYQGNKPVKIDFSYISPTIAQGAQADKLYFSKTSNNVGTGTEITSGTPITENIAFDETAQANFYINYKDAGQLELTVSDGATTPALKSGSDRFVVYPTKLTLGLSENGNYLGTKGYEFYTASKPFDLVITAVNKLNEVTANYRPGEFKLLPHMVTPLMSDGANSTTMTYVNASATNQTLTVTNSATSSDWQNVALTFGSAGYNQKASFNNVGSFALDALDDNYFSYDINADAVSAGRIIPYYFTVSTQTQGQLETTGTGYSYIGETLSYAVDPIIKIVAKDFKGTVATNYGGFGDEEGTFHSSPTLSGRTYAETSAGTGFNGGNTTLGTGAFSGHENYDGEFLVTLSDDTFTYAKSATPTPAFTSNIQLTFSEADLTARYLREENPAPADLETNVVGIGYCPEPLDLAVDQCPSEFKSYTMDLVAAPLLRYGRLKLSNTSTSATETDGKVFIPLVVEYWDAANNRYVTNTQDSVTVFNTLNGDITRVSDGAKLNNLLDRSGTKVTNGLPLNGQGLFLPVRDNSNNLLDGEYLLQLNNLPIWLNVDWNGDNKVDNQDMVSSSVIFGSFSGNNRIIYKRER